MIQPYEQGKLSQGYYTSVGTVLLRRDAAKEGQTLFLFLRDLGPRWVSAPGASGKKTRFGGATEPLVWSEFNLYQSPRFLSLQGAEVKEDFLELRMNAEKLLAALRFYKRLPKVLIAGHESNRILTLLWSSLLCLKDNDTVSAAEFRFYWRVLHEMGLAPSLLMCSTCGGKLEKGAVWSADGLVCGNCAQRRDFDDESLLALQKAALWKHDQFIRWKEADKFRSVFKNVNKKIVLFFTEFN